MGIFDRFRTKKSVTEAGAALVRTRGSNSLSISDEDGFDQDERVSQFKAYKRAYEKIPLITAIVDVQADQIVQEFYYEGPNEEKLSKWSDKVNLMHFFHRTAKSMVLYGNAYVEVIKNASEITELKILNPIWIDVWRNPVGEVTGFSQTIGDQKTVLWGTTGDKNKDSGWKKRVSKIDTIVHFRHNVLGSEKYGTSIIKPLVPAINTKLNMERDLQKVVFKYVAPLIWAKVGNNEFPANDSIVNDISSTLRDLQAESEITTSHLVELGVLQFNSKGMDIQTPINHIESQVITGGHVPPVLLGRETSVNEKAAEVQMRNFNRHIKHIQREVKIEFEDKIIVGQEMGSPEDKLIWEDSEEREGEIKIDMLRGMVTDGIITAQKANDLLPPRFREELPDPMEMQLLNQQQMNDDGTQKPRPTQNKKEPKVKANPNDPTKTTKNPRSKGRRIGQNDRTKPPK
jgi:hypothetical protein